MKPISIFRWSIVLLFVILFTQGISASLVDISAHFPKAVYIGQYDQLPGASQVATFSILEPGTVTITGEWSTWYPEIGFGRFGIIWKSPGGNWTDIPPFGEVISAVYTTNGRRIEQKDDAKDAPLKAVITYRVSNRHLPMDKYQVAMQRPNFWEGSHSQKSQDSHMTMDFTPDAGTDTAFAPSQSLSLKKLAFEPGEEISVSFTALASYAENAWIGIIPSLVAHGSEVINDQYDLTYQYLRKRTSGTLLFTAPQQNGSYDFRMNDSDDNGKEVASVSFTVGKGSISGNGAIIGTWNWFTGTKVYVHIDGTFEAWQGNQKSNYGTWTRSGYKYTFYWADGGYIDTLALSSDGQSLDGYNKGGTHVTGNKISSSDNVAGTNNTSGTGTIVGTWSWFTGTKVYMHPDGTFEAWQGNQKSNYGTWTRSGNKYTLNWVNGGYIDTVYLSPDGMSLDGYNKGGTHITGNKISSSDTF